MTFIKNDVGLFENLYLDIATFLSFLDKYENHYEKVANFPCYFLLASTAKSSELDIQAVGVTVNKSEGEISVSPLKDFLK